MSALRDLPPLEPDADHNLNAERGRNGDAALGIAHSNATLRQVYMLVFDKMPLHQRDPALAESNQK
ncbi:hypothetical protein HHL08_14050 [Sphingobium sp. AR-3-1]|uniref:Uncharacterized protein n=1 Tax=Sphingobium psychrophilum TaxID=2728834 RepID=A0A7X9WWN6_9SPHN|nr:hypothetical protein [Sphingobium psychrophilum]NML11253.1 hypothetical protein [Sphingobium psychrophilum]